MVLTVCDMVGRDVQIHRSYTIVTYIDYLILPNALYWGHALIFPHAY